MPSRIVMSVWTRPNLDLALNSPGPVIHLAGGSLTKLSGWVQEVRRTDKQLWLHIDMVSGLGRDDESISYSQQSWRPDAYVTGNLGLAQSIRAKGLPLVLRVFVHDTQSALKSAEAIRKLQPAIVQVMPAIATPTVQARFVNMSPRSEIMGAGLVSSVEERDRLLASGIRLDISNPLLWDHANALDERSSLR